MISGRSGGSSWSRWVGSMSDALPGGHLSLDAVVAFVDGELPPGPDGRASAHVDRCLTCAGEVAAQRQARRRVRAADLPSAPTSLLAALRAIPDATELPSAPAGLAVDAEGVLVARAEPSRDDAATPRRARKRPGLPVVVGSGVVVGAAALAALAGPGATAGAPLPVPAPRSTALGPQPSSAPTGPTAAAADLSLRRATGAAGLSGPGAP